MAVKIITVSDQSRDPLTLLMAPSRSETPEERIRRLQQEDEAKRISNVIDEELSKERKAPKPVKILLLGQSESGKSTTLKNFQLMHEPKAFGRERASWRAIIYLNIVRCFRLIMDAMERTQRNDISIEEDGDLGLPELPSLTPEHLKIKRRLCPLIQVESTLIRQLSPIQNADKEEWRSFESTGKDSLKEVAVNSATQWKECFRCLANSERCPSNGHVNCGDPNDPGRLLRACSEDMIRLWNDPLIQELLGKLKIRMEDHAGFFLDSLERVTAAGYLPTDDDILRARLKTLGVSEHRFRVNSITGGKDWRIYDVGGHRSLRGTPRARVLIATVLMLDLVAIPDTAAWIPYFDDVDAIIFLAPISAFDQMLEEDPKVNRLLDSFQLWSSIVSNELLSHTNLILFLNKLDIFQAKIESGIQFGKYVTSYKDRPNDVENTSDYLRKKFVALMKSNSKTPRIFFSHFTTVTDTASTKYILSNLQDALMRQNLAECNLT